MYVCIYVYIYIYIYIYIYTHLITNLFFQVAQKDGYNAEYINTSNNVSSLNIGNMGVY
jgi:hypothetical protein